MTDTQIGSPADTAARCAQVLDEIERVVVGKRGVLEQILGGVLAGGHILIEDLPGLGKTLIARSIATVLGLTFSRIQFTPDLLPADVTGGVYLDVATGQPAFRPGPIFAQLVLADEINRAPAKTQSALLEAMAERQVTTDGISRALPQPFLVLATDNPIEYEGTYPLPEAQLDRFALRVRVGYLSTGDETDLLRWHVDAAGIPAQLRPLADPAAVLGWRATLQQVEVSAHVLAYIVALLQATRRHPRLAVGASPRGGLALLQLARAHAMLAGRDYVLPDDVKHHAVAVLAHRLVLTPEMWAREIRTEQIVTDLLSTVPVPGGPADLGRRP